MSSLVERWQRLPTAALFGLLSLNITLVSTATAQQAAQGREVQRKPLTVRASIETTRLMNGRARLIRLVDGQLRPIDPELVFASPDHKHYVVMLVRGDILKNGVDVDIRVGGLESLESATHLKSVAQLFTRGLGSPNGEGSSELIQPGANYPVWMDDNRTVVIAWEDDRGIRQVLSIDTVTGTKRFLTQHTADVLRFSVGRQDSLVYSARIEHSSATSRRLISDGFVVTSPDAYSLLDGDADGFGLNDRMESFERFVVTKSFPKPRKLVMNGSTITRTSLSWAMMPQFSSDGRFAIMEASPASIPDTWSGYTHPYFKELMSAVTAGSRESNRQVLQLFVVDLRSAKGRPLWNVPIVPPTESDIKIAWAPDSRSILVSPTFLPITTSTPLSGIQGRAVAEIDILSGVPTPIPVPDDLLSAGIAGIRWRSMSEIEVESQKGEVFRFKRNVGEWDETQRDPVPRPPEESVQVKVRQGLNDPPKIIAVENATGRERLVLDLNPTLASQFVLAAVKLVNWKDDAGRSWSGLLYYPTAFTPGHRYPLVIQTHGHALPTEFSLYGPGGWQPGLGPGISVYAAQAIANRNIAVLQIQDKYVEGESEGAGEPRLYMNAFESAVRQLNEMQIVDPARVGLMGHSRMGWKVEFALSHSQFRYAAAIASDNMDAGYFQAGTMSWMPEYGEEPNGAPPFGAGLEEWLRNSPAFNVEKIHTPLQLVASTSTGGLTSLLAHGWEMFSRLRYLEKPVEWYVIPDLAHGSHSIQNPRQCLAVQERAVDWWDFWLNGHEESDSGKANQYQSWRKLRELQQKHSNSD